ncbi:MAG TPA: RNA polymerase sigma factor [Polyangiaceae bacterium]|nr:RNA polymerase sigma factor [Polyangiaceae bacterium]
MAKPADPLATDREILQLLARRDPRGFDWAYRSYSARLFGFLKRMCKGSALAEDLLQHTFLRLAERGPELHPDSDLRAWLFAVARNALLDHVRSEPATAHETVLEELFAPAPDLEARFLLGDIESALAELSSQDRELLLLAAEGFTPNQVAAIERIAPAASRQRLSRARSRLFTVLQKRDPGSRERKSS